MDKDLALLILSTCYRTTRELGDLAPVLKAHAEPQDYEHLKSVIGKSVHEIMSNIADYVAARCPDAQAEVDRRMQNYHRAF
jgi:hypothetical protein